MLSFKEADFLAKKISEHPIRMMYLNLVYVLTLTVNNNIICVGRKYNLLISFMGHSWSEQKESENHAKDILPRSSGDSEDIFCWRGGVVVLTQNETEFWLNKFHRLFMFILNCFFFAFLDCQKEFTNARIIVKIKVSGIDSW